MKQCAHKILALVAMTMLLSGSSFAQNYIRKAQYQKTNYALAREILSYKQWIVYNDNPGYFTFGRLDTSGVNNTFWKTQQLIHVRDMENINNDVYFCGSMFDSASMSNVGVMGYFSASATTPTIRYIIYDEFETLRKLDFYKVYTTQHVVMVGTGKDGIDYLVDANRETNTSGICYYGTHTWNQAWTYIPNLDAKFDDIAYLGDSIVVSARVSDSSVVYLCTMQASDISCMPFFSAGGIKTKQLIGTYPKGRVLLQRSNDDTVYVVYRYSNRLAICQFKNSTNIVSKYISYSWVSQSTYTLKDVAIDRSKQNLSVLIETFTLLGGTISNSIYHIPTAQVATGGSVNVHIYGSSSVYRPVSLSRSVQNMSVSVGSYEGEWGIAKVKNTAPTGNCTTLSTAVLNNMSKTTALPQTKTQENFSSGKQAVVMPITSPSVTVTTECY